jgi:rubrerythrin
MNRTHAEGPAMSSSAAKPRPKRSTPPARRSGARPSSPARAPRRARDGADAFRVPPSLAGPKVVFLWCRACGYGPPTVPPGGSCPKCGGHSWERFALSARLVPERPTRPD